MNFLRIVLLSVLLMLGTVANATLEKLGVTQTRNLEIVISLTGVTTACGYRPEQPMLTLTGSLVVVTQGAYFPECPPPAPPTYRYDPFAYLYSTNLGVLSDGTYSVEWRFFPADGSHFLPQYQGNPYRTSFEVRAGALVDPLAVPTTQWPWLVTTILVLAGLACFALRRR